MDDRAKNLPFTDSQPIYYDVSPKIVWTLNIVGIVTLLMVVLSFIFCLVQASNANPIFYLLACNIVISCLIGLVNVWWYRREHLSSDKYWYIFILAAVLIWQCLATDVYVFNLPSKDAGNMTTVSPVTEQVRATTI